MDMSAVEHDKDVQILWPVAASLWHDGAHSITIMSLYVCTGWKKKKSSTSHSLNSQENYSGLFKEIVGVGEMWGSWLHVSYATLKCRPHWVEVVAEMWDFLQQKPKKVTQKQDGGSKVKGLKPPGVKLIGSPAGPMGMEGAHYICHNISI